MPYARKIAGEWVELLFGSFVIGDGEEAIQYPGDWPERATKEEREEIGLFEIEEAPPMPDDVVPIGTRLADRGGKPVRENVFEQYTPAQAGEIMWNRAKAYRQSMIDAGAPTPEGVADADLESRVNVLGGVQMATLAKMLNQPFEIAWTMHDDSVRFLDGDRMIAMAMAVGSYAGRCHAASQAIRKQIKKAAAGSSAAAVFQIDVTAGYPDA